MTEEEKVELDTDFTDYITCPYCGYENKDSWELEGSEDPEETNCHSCGKEFNYWAHTIIYYCTEKIEEAQAEAIMGVDGER